MVVQARAVEGMGVTPHFWAGKRVFMTGHTGFKGSWLSLWLQQLGSRVVGYALAPPSQPNLFEVARVADGMSSLHGDVRELSTLQAAMSKHQPQIVIHMAAQSLVRHSYEQPVETYATNVMGTVNLLEAVRRTPGVQAVVIVTSDKCYENKEWPWGYREYEPMGGHDPYSNSKGCAELVTSAFRKSFFNDSNVRIASVRAGNVIGGGDWAADRLMPDLMRAMAGEGPLLIRNPNAIRPWQHVLNPLSGYLTLAEQLWDRKQLAAGWNFGPHEADARPVSWIAEKIIGLWGSDAPQWRVDDAQHPHEAHYLKLDSSKARFELGWSAKLPLAEGLEWIVDWHKAYGRKEDMRACTDAQIARFQSLVRDEFNRTADAGK
jgi:CDP-glucose 4,6-dehydratase